MPILELRHSQGFSNTTITPAYYLLVDVAACAMETGDVLDWNL